MAFTPDVNAVEIISSGESGGSGTLLYDNNGNLTHWTSFFGMDYSYDEQNRLIHAARKNLSDPIGITVSYRYINE